jgi:hypothetical protein
MKNNICQLSKKFDSEMHQESKQESNKNQTSNWPQKWSTVEPTVAPSLRQKNGTPKACRGSPSDNNASQSDSSRDAKSTYQRSGLPSGLTSRGSNTTNVKKPNMKRSKRNRLPTLKLLTYNLREGLQQEQRIASLYKELDTTKYDIIGVCETHLREAKCQRWINGDEHHFDASQINEKQYRRRRLHYKSRVDQEDHGG